MEIWDFYNDIAKELTQGQGSKNQPSPVRVGANHIDINIRYETMSGSVKTRQNLVKLGGLGRVREMTRSTR